MSFTLKANITVTHRRHTRSPEDAQDLIAALCEEIGRNDVNGVVDGSDYLKLSAPVLKELAIYGSRLQGYSLLVCPDGARQMQVTVEVEEAVRFESACQTSYDNVKKALSSKKLNLGPRLKGIDVTIYGDTRTLFSGNNGIRSELLSPERRWGIVSALLTSVGVGVLSFFWSSQALSLWAGNLAPLSTLGFLLFEATSAGLGDTIRWAPGKRG